MFVVNARTHAHAHTQTHLLYHGMTKHEILEKSAHVQIVHTIIPAWHARGNIFSELLTEFVSEVDCDLHENDLDEGCFLKKFKIGGITIGAVRIFRAGSLREVG